MVLRIWSQRFKDRDSKRFKIFYSHFKIFLINLINGDSLTREESNQIFFSNSFYQHYWGIFFLIRRFFNYWFNTLNYSSIFFDYFEACLNHHRQIITIQSFFRFVIAEFSFKISILRGKGTNPSTDSKSKRHAMEYKKNTEVGSLHRRGFRSRPKEKEEF